MKQKLWVMSLLGFILFFGTFNWTGCTAKKVVTENTPETTQPERPPQPAFITALKESIKGKEQLPAEQVFTNIDVLKGVPAGRIIPIMQFGYSRSLGVQCTHCHVRGNWAADTNPNKEIAREMSRMTKRINQELLKEIKNLKSDQPVVNCTTCHRGQVKPALDIK